MIRLLMLFTLALSTLDFFAFLLIPTSCNNGKQLPELNAKTNQTRSTEKQSSSSRCYGLCPGAEQGYAAKASGNYSGQKSNLITHRPCP